MSKYLSDAAKLAYSELSKDFLLGCIALRKDGTLVKAVNIHTQKPHPQTHAEARVLKKAGMGAILWVARVTRDKQWRMAKPCPACQMLIRNRKVAKVYYTTGPGTWQVWTP